MSKRSKSIFVLYPFTPSTMGADDNYVVRSNSSNAFFVALRAIQQNTKIEVKAVFLTDKGSGYEIDEKKIIYQFSPMTFSTSVKNKGFGSQWSVNMVWSVIKEKPGLVFLFISGGWFAIFLALVCRLFSIPYCPIIAGWGTSTRRSQKWYYRNALHVVVHTNAHKALFKKSGVDTSNFLVMPMGVDTSLFSMKNLEQYELRGRPVRFAHVGRIEPGKNLLGALRVFTTIREKYPNTYFDIIGPAANKDYYQQVLSFIRDNHLDDHVILHGFIPNEALPAFYAKADLMLFPTLSESFGFVLAESMACGTPVAALRGRGSPDEIIEDGVDGILANNEAEMADEILKLFQNPDRVTAMGKSARQKVELHFSANRTYAQLLELIHKAKA
jgi:glycosyltransferase involved in cell wall biosynthesis